MLLLQFVAPSGQGAVGLVSVPILEIVLDGAPASVIDGASRNVAGSIVIVDVGDVAGCTFFSVGDQQTLQTAQGVSTRWSGSGMGASAPRSSATTWPSSPTTLATCCSACAEGGAARRGRGAVGADRPSVRGAARRA